MYLVGFPFREGSMICPMAGDGEVSVWCCSWQAVESHPEANFFSRKGKIGKRRYLKLARYK